ncbi:MAG: PD-(D/E)XK nuclease family protein, partial [Kiloniellales bacterium]|nr:PD-(D/E)XK nuclease family protein [Kiloniellales bacterium]
PERMIGMAAHDFISTISADEIYVTRAKRSEGAPTVPSRWLLRIDALRDAFADFETTWNEREKWDAWARAIDRPETVRPIAPPAPTPPLEARPNRLSVTRIEAWLRDPYGLYAERILRLKALDPLDADPGAAERGTIIHHILERFIKKYPEGLPDDAEAQLLEIGRQAFAEFDDRPGLQALWWPRFERIAGWVVAREKEDRRNLRKAFAELRGEIRLDLEKGPFEITAKADRIDLGQDGTYRILDYKTGSPPGKKDVESGPSCQLPLEAAIAAAGGFEGLDAGETAALVYWHLSGGVPPGNESRLKVNAALLAETTMERVRRLITAFQDSKMPYEAIPNPSWAPRFNDYEHLARLREWAVAGREEE